MTGSNSTWAWKSLSPRLERLTRLSLVEDLKAARVALEAGGYDIVLDTQLQGFERFYTFDPFGNRLELVCPAPSA